MLSAAENEKITRVGPGTPCGELFRRYWIPAALSEELPESDGAPATHRFVSKTFEECNWLQALEGGIDTSHSSFAHRNDLHNATLTRRDGHPRIDVEKNAYGYRYSSTRQIDGDQDYVRVYQFVMPSQQMRGSVTERTGERAKVPKLAGHVWIPRDDETTFVYNTLWSFDPAITLNPDFVAQWEASCGRGKDDLLPGYRLKANKANDDFIDRRIQKTRTYTGIAGLNTQDYALQEGMGPIVDRTKEHLGTSDRAIIAARQLLFEGIDAVAAGEAPRGTDPATYRDVRPYDDYVGKATDWHAAFAPELVAKW